MKESTRPLIEATERAVEIIAMARAAATIVDEMPAEDFDKILNEQCETAFEKFKGKGKKEVMAMLMAHVIKSDPSFLLDLILGGPDDESDF